MGKVVFFDEEKGQKQVNLKKQQYYSTAIEKASRRDNFLRQAAKGKSKKTQQQDIIQTATLTLPSEFTIDLDNENNNNNDVPIEDNSKKVRKQTAQTKPTPRQPSQPVQTKKDKPKEKEKLKVIVNELILHTQQLTLFLKRLENVMTELSY